MTLSIGIDIGGTFTDVVAIDSASGALHYTKVNSTPASLVQGFVRGIDQALGLASKTYGDISRITHGTTVGTNAILEARGATIGVLVTEGFEDILTIGRQKRSDMYDVFIEAETPVFLAPRRRVMGIRERVYPDGEVDIPLDEGQVAKAVDTLVEDHGVQAIAVCYLFSFAGPSHEERTGEIIQQRRPGVHVSLSSRLDPRFREYERLCLTAFDAYLRPVVERYIKEVRTELDRRGARARFHIMHSRGGVTSDETILGNTVSTVLSGPAAGVVGGVFSGKLCGLGDLITLDMGGTSCDIALVENGKPILSSEGKIAKYPLRQPMLEINTIGAGGGSIAWLDGSGAVRVGPRSAGAAPGPACYDNGGDEPTVTDAGLVLGYLDPKTFAGGTMSLNRSRAENAIRSRIAGPLNMGLLEAAEGIHTIVNNNMADEIRLVSVVKGYDPRNFALVAMGGAGPVHAGRLARQSNIRRVIVPRSPGVLSAFGLLVANLEHERARTFRTEALGADLADLGAQFADLEAECRRAMERDATQGRAITASRSVEMRYLGQSYELELPFSPGPVDSKALKKAIEDFHTLHERVYGHRDADHLAEFVTLRVILSQAPSHSWTPPEIEKGPADPGPAQIGARQAYFAEAGGLVNTPVYARDALAPGVEITGPAIIQQEDTTTVVYPGHGAAVDKYGNLLMEIPLSG